MIQKILIELKQSARVNMVHLNVNIFSTDAYGLIIESYFTELQNIIMTLLCWI